MQNDILSKLDGTHSEFIRLEMPDKPSKNIVLGTLGDKSKDYSNNPDETTRTITTVNFFLSFSIPN
jgi:hypothetical protein